jgi:hypothetical protein
MTATLLSDYAAPANVYSYFGGNVDLLANGDIETDFCAPKTGAVVQEFNESSGSAQIVWQATTPGAAQYRAVRLPSLYAGVQW